MQKTANIQRSETKISSERKFLLAERDTRTAKCRKLPRSAPPQKNEVNKIASHLAFSKASSEPAPGGIFEALRETLARCPLAEHGPTLLAGTVAWRDRGESRRLHKTKKHTRSPFGS